MVRSQSELVEFLDIPLRKIEQDFMGINGRQRLCDRLQPVIEIVEFF